MTRDMSGIEHIDRTLDVSLAAGQPSWSWQLSHNRSRVPSDPTETMSGRDVREHLSRPLVVIASVYRPVAGDRLIKQLDVMHDTQRLPLLIQQGADLQLASGIAGRNHLCMG